MLFRVFLAENLSESSVETVGSLLSELSGSSEVAPPRLGQGRVPCGRLSKEQNRQCFCALKSLPRTARPMLRPRAAPLLPVTWLEACPSARYSPRRPRGKPAGRTPGRHAQPDPKAPPAQPQPPIHHHLTLPRTPPLTKGRAHRAAKAITTAIPSDAFLSFSR